MRDWIAAQYELGWPLAEVCIDHRRIKEWGLAMTDIQRPDLFVPMLVRQLSHANNWPHDAIPVRLHVKADRDAIALWIMSQSLKRVGEGDLIPELLLEFNTAETH